jgi:hypothetical protein
MEKKICSWSFMNEDNISSQSGFSPTDAIPTWSWQWGLSARETLRAIPAVA